MQLKVPKALLGTISELTSEKYNETANEANKVVTGFQLKETRKVTNVGDTIIDIELDRNATNDIILVKGASSTLVPQPPRKIQVQH